MRRKKWALLANEIVMATEDDSETAATSVFIATLGNRGSSIEKTTSCMTTDDSKYMF